MLPKSDYYFRCAAEIEAEARKCVSAALRASYLSLANEYRQLAEAAKRKAVETDLFGTDEEVQALAERMTGKTLH